MFGARLSQIWCFGLRHCLNHLVMSRISCVEGKNVEQVIALQSCGIVSNKRPSPRSVSRLACQMSDYLAIPASAASSCQTLLVPVIKTNFCSSCFDYCPLWLWLLLLTYTGCTGVVGLKSALGVTDLHDTFLSSRHWLLHTVSLFLTESPG